MSIVRSESVDMVRRHLHERTFLLTPSRTTSMKGLGVAPKPEVLTSETFTRDCCTVVIPGKTNRSAPGY